MGLSLYEIDQNIRSILDSLYESTDEDGEIEEDAFQILEDLAQKRDAKWEAIALYIKECLAEADALKAEEKKLKERREAKERKADRLKIYLAQSMIASDQMKFETAKCQISFRRSESVSISNEREIPPKYRQAEISYKIDKAGIKKALKAGEEIEGASLEEKQNIQIK